MADAQKRLPGILKALIVVHGVIAVFLLLYALFQLVLSILVYGVPFPVLSWWIEGAKGLIDVDFFVQFVPPSFASHLFGSVIELFGFALAGAYAAFRVLLRRHKKSALAALCAIALIELGVIVCWFMLNGEILGARIVFGYIAPALPIAAALILTCFCVKSIKSHLEANK